MEKPGAHISLPMFSHKTEMTQLGHVHAKTTPQNVFKMIQSLDRNVKISLPSLESLQDKASCEILITIQALWQGTQEKTELAALKTSTYIVSEHSVK